MIREALRSLRTNAIAGTFRVEIEFRGGRLALSVRLRSGQARRGASYEVRPALLGLLKRQNCGPKIDSQRILVCVDKCRNFWPKATDWSKQLFRHRAESGGTEVFDTTDLLREPMPTKLTG